MDTETLTLWGKGAVTLPKKWRERYRTKHFLAKENKSGNLEIIPIVDAHYYEDEKGNFGLQFPMGIEAGELLTVMDKAIEKKKRRSSHGR